MEFSSDDSDWESEERVEEFYHELKEKNSVRKNLDGTLRCPYCTGKKKQDYLYKDLLQHASGVGRSGKDLKRAARHRALEKLLLTDCKDEPSTYVASLSRYCAPKHRKVEISQERFVWPWMGIIVNIPLKGTDGANLTTASKLKEMFIHFNPLKACPIWDNRGFRGLATIQFGTGLTGYHDAVSFQMSFDLKNCGKKDWMKSQHGSSRMFGWLASEADYEGGDPQIRNHLRKYGNLKTINDVQIEEKRERYRLVADLRNEIDTKNRYLQCSGKVLSEVTYALSQTRSTLSEMESHLPKLIDQYAEDKKRYDSLLSNFEKRKGSSINSEKQKDKVERDHNSLQQEVAENEDLINRIVEEREKNDATDAGLEGAASKQHNKAEESLMEPLEEHENDASDAGLEGSAFKQHKKLEESLMEPLEAHENLETEIEVVKEKIQMLEHMMDDDVRGKEADLKDMEYLHNTLVKKESSLANAELVEARKEAIAGFEELFSQSNCIGVKRMGELGSKAFEEGYMKRYKKPYDPGTIQTVVSEWQARLRDSRWRPFKAIQHGDQITEIIDGNDEKLKALKADWGEEAFNTVVCALKELIEYHPGRLCPVKVLWNFNEDRNVTLKEAIQHLVKYCKDRNTLYST